MNSEYLRILLYMFCIHMPRNAKVIVTHVQQFALFYAAPISIIYEARNLPSSIRPSN